MTGEVMAAGGVGDHHGRMVDLTATLHGTMPLCATLGMRALAMDADRVVLAIDWSPALCTSGGVLHGGALMALADAAGAACAFANLPEGAAGTSTLESRTSFLRAVRAGTLTATARPLHVGSTTIVVETELRDGDDRLAGKVSQTQIVLRSRT